LGCVSCHDPHRLPAPAEKTAFYNGRCATCHTEAKTPCTLPLPERRAAGDNCTACHMPALGTQINHTAVTDHRVPRRPQKDAPPASPPAKAKLVPFGVSSEKASKPSDSAQAQEFERNLGIALVMAADGQRIGREELRDALGMLERAVARDPGDVPAQEACALALSSQGRHAESLRMLETVLARHPRREFALVNAATEAKHLGRIDLAIDYWKRAAAVNPTQVRYQVSLARTCLDARSWEDCATAARAALALQPSSPQSRQYLVRALLGLKKIAEAEAEFATLMRMDPPDPDALRRWFTEERGGPGP
jgi:tetratricopeptide (TPR) repeat protein